MTTLDVHQETRRVQKTQDQKMQDNVFYARHVTY